MSQKKKDIEVRIEETEEQRADQTYMVHTLFVGKKEIGKVTEEAPKKYIVELKDEQPLKVASFDDGYEVLIRHWNLFQ